MSRARKTIGNWRWWAALPVVLPAAALSLLLYWNKRLWRLPQAAANTASVEFERATRPLADRLHRWVFG